MSFNLNPITWKSIERFKWYKASNFFLWSDLLKQFVKQPWSLCRLVSLHCHYILKFVWATLHYYLVEGTKFQKSAPRCFDADMQLCIGTKKSPWKFEPAHFARWRPLVHANFEQTVIKIKIWNFSEFFDLTYNAYSGLKNAGRVQSRAGQVSALIFSG